jgi:flavorubredoxin
MNVTEVTRDIYRLSANTHDILFEGIWPIPNGVSMNSYIIRGEKTAIVDGVCGWDGVPETLFAQLRLLEIDPADIDYLIVNHMEPDHSGWIEAFRKLRSEGFTVVTSAKAVPLLEAFLGPGLPVRVVKDGERLDLGRGHVLQFIEIPNVHWPETIATFDEGTSTLLPCDAFGSYGAIEGAPYDDQLSPAELRFFEGEAVRYYANIVAGFSFAVTKAIDKVERLIGPQIKIIAPGHGIVWRKDPGKIVADYKEYARWQKGPARPEVTFIWGSMYGNTEAAVAPAIEALEMAGVTVHEHRVPQSHIGDILASIWSSTGVVLAMPTYEYKMFPPLAAVLDELGRKKVQNRLAFRFGSFGWSGGAQGELDEIMERHKMGWNFLQPVEFKGKPTADDIGRIAARATELAGRVKTAAKAGVWEAAAEVVAVS